MRELDGVTADAAQKEERKTKFIAAQRKMQGLHNDYLLAVTAANALVEDVNAVRLVPPRHCCKRRQIIVPNFLCNTEAMARALVDDWHGLLDRAYELLDFTADEFRQRFDGIRPV